MTDSKHWASKQYIRDGKTLVDCFYMEDRVKCRLAIVCKIGIGRTASKLVAGEDYHNFKEKHDGTPRTTAAAVRTWLNRITFRAGKGKSELELQTKKYGVGFDEECETMARSFSTKGSRAFDYATGKLEPKPLQKMIDKKKHEKAVIEKKERESFYADQETGMF